MDRLAAIKANWAEHLDSDSDAAWLVGECERLRACRDLVEEWLHRFTRGRGEQLLTMEIWAQEAREALGASDEC
jgi:hypothetical protein